jgi:hypothetical protein
MPMVGMKSFPYTAKGKAAAKAAEKKTGKKMNKKPVKKKSSMVRKKGM